MATDGESAGTKVKVGSLAPDFTLHDQRGNPVTLSSFRGKKNVVLFFYPADSTLGCTAQACSFRDAYEELRSADAEILGVSEQGTESKAKFASAQRLQFPILSDPGNEVSVGLYGVPRAFLGLVAGRTTFILDKAGVIRRIFSQNLDMASHAAEAKRVLMGI